MKFIAIEWGTQFCYHYYQKGEIDRYTSDLQLQNEWAFQCRYCDTRQNPGWDLLLSNQFLETQGMVDFHCCLHLPRL